MDVHYYAKQAVYFLRQGRFNDAGYVVSDMQKVYPVWNARVVSYFLAVLWREGVGAPIPTGILDFLKALPVPPPELRTIRYCVYQSWALRYEEPLLFSREYANWSPGYYTRIDDTLYLSLVDRTNRIVTKFQMSLDAFVKATRLDARSDSTGFIEAAKLTTDSPLEIRFYSSSDEYRINQITRDLA